MRKKILTRHGIYNGIRFIFYPIVFFLVGFVICHFAFSSMLNSFDRLLSVFTYYQEPKFDEDSEQENLMKTAVENGEIAIPKKNQEFAKIKIDSAGINASVFYGDDATQLLKGVGCCRAAYVPGQCSTVMMCAHNNTYFHTLGEVNIGDKIEITTNYGHYVYEMTGSKVANESDTSAYDLYKNEENLILYTCYPFDELRLTPLRYFVYAKYVSGPLDRQS